MRFDFLRNIDTKAKMVANIKDKCATVPSISAKPLDGRIPFDCLLCREYSHFRIVGICRSRGMSNFITPVNTGSKYKFGNRKLGTEGYYVRQLDSMKRQSQSIFSSKKSMASCKTT